MPESAETRIITEANLVDFMTDWSGTLPADVTKFPYYVKFNGDTSPEGIAFNTAALQAAFNNGGQVQLPKGICIIDGDLSIGSHTHVRGHGKRLTTLRVKDGASWNRRGIYFPLSAQHSSLSRLTVDGNASKRLATDGLGGIYGTNVSAIGSRHIHFDHVESIHAVQHGFDATTPFYSSAGDGAPAPADPSEFIYYTDCETDQYGDDGFSSHGSGKIWYTRCKALGTRWALTSTYTNSNGFEADDFSYDITHTDCYATKSAHGFETKAHGPMSAATNIKYIGCTAEGNEVNFSARHIGHHMASHPYSKTAKHVQVIGCTFKNPRRVFFGGSVNADGDVPWDEVPENAEYWNAVVGAYRGLQFVACHFEGDPDYNYNGAANVLIHFRAESVSFSVCYFEGFTTGNWDIQSTGGDQPGAYLAVDSCHFRDSAIGGVSAGAASQANVTNNWFNRAVPNSPNGVGVRTFGNKTVRNNKFITEYQYNFNISNVFYRQYETPLAANVAYDPQPVVV